MNQNDRSTLAPTVGAHWDERLAWLWLLAGTALLPFAAWQTIVPLAVWLAPVFLLRFERISPWRRLTLPLIFLANTAAILISLRGDTPTDPWILAFGLITTPLLRGVVYTLPYLADSQIGRRLGAWGRLLTFPLAYTTVDWLLSALRLSNGNAGSPAYSQAAVLPLAQVVSLTGMWGLTFLITWFASTMNALWEQRFNCRPARAQMALFAVVLLAVFGYGGARLLWAAPSRASAQAPSVVVAAISSDRAVNAAASSAINWGTFYQYSDAQRAALRPQLAATVDAMLARTETALRGGAQLVSWSETAAFVLEEDLPGTLGRAAALAREYHGDVQLGLGVLTRANNLQYLRNQAILIDATGAVRWTYDKTYPVFPDEAFVVPYGAGQMPAADRPYGRLGSVICQDIHFPALLRQASQGGVDVLLDPSSDIAAFSDMDKEIATLRAIENGVTLVRPNGNGPTRMFDSQGRVLAERADTANSSGILLASVPAHRAATLYGQVGDVFAYGCALGLIVLAGIALARRGQPAAQRATIGYA